MSTQLNEQQLEALGVAETAPLLRRRSPALRLSQQAAQLLASCGRAAVIWLPVYALIAGHYQSFRALLGVSLVITLVWYLALRAAFAAARLTLLALGPTIAALLGTVTGLAAVSAVNFWLPGMQISPDRLLAISALIFALSAIWEGLVYRSIAGFRRVLIVGAGEGGSELIEELAHMPDSPFEVIGLVDDERETDRVGGVPVHGRIGDLPAIVEAQRPDIVVLAVTEKRVEALSGLLSVASTGFTVIGLPQFYEHAFGRIPIRHVSASWFMGVMHLYQRPYSRLAKRTFDVLVAGTGLLLAAPLLPFLYLLVRRTPGDVIYRQKRLGESGVPYTMYKFRSMAADAEASGAAFAAEQDPRITGVGRFLRKSRLDELPQLYNVLRGDMSIVGPRPERPEFHEMLEETIPFWSQRHLVKPGVTGWAQIRSAYASDVDSMSGKLSYDLWYLRHRSLFLDLAVCVKTFTTLISGAGAR